MKPHSDVAIAVAGRQIPSLHLSQSSDELSMMSLWMTPGICIPWLLDPSFLSISSFQWTGHHLQWQRSMLQHQSQCSGEWYLVRRGHMLWKIRLLSHLYVFSSFLPPRPPPPQWLLVLTSKPFELHLRYLGQRQYGSGKMYWVTFGWPWPKVTAVTLINKNLLVCRIKWKSRKQSLQNFAAIYH